MLPAYKTTRVESLLLPENCSDEIKTTFKKLGFLITSDEQHQALRVDWSQMRRFDVQDGREINNFGWFTFGVNFSQSEWEFNLQNENEGIVFRFFYSKQNKNPEEAVALRVYSSGC